MNRSLCAASTVVLVCFFSSCQIKQPLTQEAWSGIGKGSQSLGVSTGWAWVDADITLTGLTGALEGAGSGTDTADLDPNYGVGLKYYRFLNPNLALGGIIEARSFDADPAAPLGAVLDADDFTTLHLILSSRYYFTPIGDENRLRFLLGLDLGFVPGIDTDATATFFDPMGDPVFVDDVDLSGDEFFTLGAVAGLSYLLRDDLSFDTGFFYEWALDESSDIVDINVPEPMVGFEPSTARGEVEEEGLYFAFGLTWFF